MSKGEKPKSQGRTIARRDLLKSVAGMAAVSVMPQSFFIGAAGKSPNEKLNIAGVGIGGMGRNNLKRCEDENIVALCDVDQKYAAPIFAKYPNATKYVDYREMFDKQKDIDAVIIATPDHNHAVIAMAAIKAGKHVYVQKPMAHYVNEARALTEAAREKKVMTQMGNQGRSGDGTRVICEWLWSGAIGNVTEVHAWTNRPVWPQGIEVERPKDTPAVPDTLNWDLWIGPAQMRPYNPCYLPESWRAWWDFGTGSLGDLGCHLLDSVFWGLKLKYPTSVEGNISTYWEGFWKRTEPKNETYPRSSIVRYAFPEREGMPPVKLSWYDGGLMPARPEELGDRKMGDSDGGVIFIGDKGKLMCGCYGKNPQLLPEEAMKDFKQPEPTLPRVPGGEDGHEKDWVRSCKDGNPASSTFDYSGPLSEMVLMGNLAVRFPNERLLWDGESMKVTNNPEADKYVRSAYREGWTL
jgi:predicted dehydrogenase